MSKTQKEDLPEVENPLGNTGKFVQENSKSLAVIGIAIVALILLYVGYQNFYLKPRAEKAANEMFRAEEYVAVDSLSDKAISGDGSYPGFEKIAEEYSNTKSANIANAYLGGLYLKKGEFQKAVDALGKYSSTGSPIVDPLVLGMLGDAYSELKDYDRAVTYYKKAADKSKNAFTSPLFLKKLGLVYEEQKDFSAAADAYNKIKTDFPESFEASTIDSYIARAETQVK
ncbi:tetratricopeptide repeat protein [Daejeonella lutea]|uniref:TPR repeat-containing protein n=1 Tax=Daejeonella lutea TaxID=572036 RepID=A0A1T5CV43_9SPHI|nr:tetratricopeptide repeat protein [Daejeonella lutea]SKB63070.1 TPR repeat-containing protein [Daejeonella lutea]